MTYGHVYGIGAELIRAMRKMPAPKAKRYVRTGSCCKITDDEVREIRREFAKGGYDPALFCGIVAGAYGMHWQSIRSIVYYCTRNKHIRTDPSMIPLS